jgi:hypothetical protein
MNIKVFSEYKVKEEYLETFKALVPQIKRYYIEIWGVQDCLMFEAVDQPCLFVEEFQVNSIEQYERIKHWRKTTEELLWLKVNECTSGGVEKTNIWAFKLI